MYLPVGVLKTIPPHRNDGRRIVEIDNALLRVAFECFGRVGAEIHCRAGAAKGADAVERLARGGLVLEHDGKTVLVERDIGVGDIAVDEAEKSVRLDGERLALCFNGGEDKSWVWQCLLRQARAILYGQDFLASEKTQIADKRKKPDDSAVAGDGALRARFPHLKIIFTMMGSRVQSSTIPTRRHQLLGRPHDQATLSAA